MRGSNRGSEVRGDNACREDETHTGVANPIRVYADLVLSPNTIAFASADVSVKQLAVLYPEMTKQ